MRYRLFNNTGLYVSEICLGTMTFGGKGFWEAIGKLTTAEAETLIGAAFDAGVNFIDTADAYAEGESEKFVGAALAALHRPREGADHEEHGAGGDAGEAGHDAVERHAEARDVPPAVGGGEAQ